MFRQLPPSLPPKYKILTTFSEFNFRPMKPAAVMELGSNPGPVPLSMASSPLRLLREESMDANGTLSPISSRSNGTDTETDAKKKVSSLCYNIS